MTQSQTSDHVSYDEALVSSLPSLGRPLEGILRILRLVEVFAVATVLNEVAHRSFEFGAVFIEHVLQVLKVILYWHKNRKRFTKSN